VNCFVVGWAFDNSRDSADWMVIFYHIGAQAHLTTVKGELV